MKRSMKKMAFASSLLLSLSVALPLSPVVYAETPQSTQFSQEDMIQDLINQGYLERVGRSQQVRITEKYKKEILEQTDLTRYSVTFTENSVAIAPKFQTRSFTGVNKIVFHSVYCDVYLDSTRANQLAAGTAFAGGLEDIVPNPIAKKIIHYISIYGTTLIAWNNAAGRGIIISVATIGVPGATLWIRSQ